MSEKLTIGWLREMIDHQMLEYRKNNSMLLESPYEDGANIEISNDLPWSEMYSMLMGESDVEMVAIMTPENPLEWKGVAEYDSGDESGEGLARRNAENANRRKNFEDVLEEQGYKLYSIGGSYGDPENSYIVPNMPKEMVIELGKKWGQDSVIHGNRTEEGSMEYSMLKTSEGGRLDQAAGIRYGVIHGPKADARNDLFSSYNGVKFYIPFYDDVESEQPDQPEQEEVPVE
jgi:hypothetical protein